MPRLQDELVDLLMEREPVRAERVDLVEKSLGVRVPYSALKWI